MCLYNKTLLSGWDPGDSMRWSRIESPDMATETIERPNEWSEHHGVRQESFQALRQS